ncbi:MAG: lysoplasmalogenase [Armatimonadota bacterium]
MRSRLAGGLAALTWLSVLAMLSREWLGIGGPARAWLIAASTGFVLVRVVRGGLDGTPGRLLLAGLIACWFGDYLGPVNFIGSVAAFGLAHLLFVGAFVAIGIDRARIPAPAAVMLVVGVAIGWWLLPQVPADQRPMIVGYMLVISAMVVAAWGMRDHPARTILIVAAMIFYLSDIFVARWRFVSPGPENAWLCYPLYYAACLLFALAPVGAAHSRASEMNRS